MTTVFDAARGCLLAGGIDGKPSATGEAAARWSAGLLDWRGGDDVETPARPARPERPLLVPPRDVPRRRLRSPAGLVAFVHAIAHIEFNAIDLAWDCVCRFRAMPRDFYADWVAVAADEARHFSMLRQRLIELGADYGDLPAHGGLWEMAERTTGDLAARLAMVPRVLEARALDVTPGMIARLRRAGDERTAGILSLILDEEVAHVAAGTRWFRFECARRGLEPDATFRSLRACYWRGAAPGPLNVEYRRRAGFTDAELS